MSINPLPGRVVVRDDANETRSKGSNLVVPNYMALTGDSFLFGTVVAVADEETALKPGDRVMFPFERGMPVKFEGEELLGVLRSDITARIDS